MTSDDQTTVVSPCCELTDLETLHESASLKTHLDPAFFRNAALNDIDPPSDPLGAIADLSSDGMTFSSSPVLFPASSSPPVPSLARKRKLFQPFPSTTQPKKQKLIGGFLADSDEERDEDDKRAKEVPFGSARAAPEAILPPLEPETSRTRASVGKDVPPSANIPPPALVPRSFMRRLGSKTLSVQMSSGKAIEIQPRQRLSTQSDESIIAERSITAPGRAKRSYYGIDIHKLMDDAKSQRQLDQYATQAQKEKLEAPASEAQVSMQTSTSKPMLHQMWTEKYRAKKFTELVGDERTHRSVLRWLKMWDDIVFPGSTKMKAIRKFDETDPNQHQHKKILLLTGPPGLGKTTLAHVCAKQAGYEVLEINASDDRSKDVVKGRIKDVLGTETVRGIKEDGKARKAGRPICVVVDEVDGVTTGSASAGGEGGFVKALLDLVQLDQRNSNKVGNDKIAGTKKGDRFRMLRPLILVCNDVYAPSLRPLRTSAMAEIVHVRKAPIDKVIARVKTVFEKESIACDNDAVRRLCEDAWGLAMRKQRGSGSRGSGEGDIRGVLVEAEGIARKLRNADAGARLTRKWLEPHLGNTREGQMGLGRGGVREVVERVFVEGAGLPNLPTALSAEDARLVADSKTNPVGVADLRKRVAITALREMVDTCGDHDRLMTDCFATYPTQVFQDDVQLTKPNASYEWLHLHDRLSSRIFSGQEWELTPYLSTGACGFHHLFASIDKGPRGWNEDSSKVEEDTVKQHPFSGQKADFAAYEAEKQNRALLTEMQSSFSASLLRLFSSVDAIAMELVPSVGRILAPDVKPVVIGGSGGASSIASVRKESEKQCVQSAVRAMLALDVNFEKVRLEVEGGGAHSNGGYVYRMEP